MSSVHASTRPVGILKRLTALEKMEVHAVTADITLGALDINAILEVTSGTGKTVTFPQDSADTKILIGHWGLIRQGGAGAVSLVAGASATINEQIADLAGAGRVARWTKVAANTYDITGNYVS